MSGQRYSVTIDVGADISSAKSAAQQLKNVFEGIGLGAGQSSKISGMFKDLDKAFDEVARRSSTALTSIGEVRGLDKAKERVVSIINAINSEFAKMGKLGDTDLAKNFGDLTRRVNDASKAIKTYNSTIGSLSKGHTTAKSRANELGQELAEQTKYYEQLQRIRDKFKGSSDKDISEVLAKKQSTAKGLATRRQNELENFVKAHGGRINADKTVDKGWRKSFESKASAEDVEILNKLVTAAQNASNAFKTAQENYQNFSNAMSNFKGQKNFDDLTKSAREAADELKKFESGTLSTEAFNKLKSALEQAFGPEVTAGIQNSATAVEEFQERINQISAKELDEFRKKVPEIDNLLNQLADTGEKMGEKVKKGTESFYNMKEAASDIEHLSSRLKYFFSLAGGFNLMRRAIRSAVTTTKELDAVMTQTAVVSSYTVKDMWKTLPQYSKEAKKLGVAIKDVYSAQTLYVQQGLDMNSAMDIGVETMKMARVANIGAEEATNSMTAALRGFNMELTEKSAKRVNDVYSKLAQNTASNTQEISTAMTKTAALANSANMSFENTAAFLATIIESTREGAETAGTALKTVIARFTEVKKLYSHGELLGTDEEGQEVDVNKISKALRTAGINMNEFFTGAKGLDEIFIELGSKWDSLSTVQQRYIATMAAGSRQQSRFLALMQNYNRTVELTEMAYNSAGSGQEQFDKTLESLDAKINKFKDSWDTFIMGLANSDAIKGFIDVGTGILDVLNKIINAISGENGIIKSISSMIVGIGVFKVGRSIFGRGGFLGSLLSGQGLSAGERFGQTFLGGMAKEAKVAQRGELRKTLGIYTGNAVKKNLKVFGKGAVIGDTYFNEKQLQNIRKTAQNYKDDINDLDKIIAESNERLSRPTVSSRVEPGRVDEQTQEEILKDEQERAEAQRRLEKANAERQETLEDYNKEQQKNGLTPEQSKAALEDPGNIPEATANYKALANAALLAGGAMLAVGAAFESLGGAGEKVGGVLKDLGSSLMIFGMVATTLQAIGKAIPTLSASLGGPAGIAIAGVVAAITVAISLFDRFTESAAEKKERITKTIQDNQNELQQLQQEYKEIDNTIDSLSNKQEALSNLTQHTLEWKNAVAELNQEIYTLIENFPEFIEAVEYDENGNLKFNVKTAREINEQKKQKETTNKLMDIAAKQQLRDEQIKVSSDPFALIAPNGGNYKNKVRGGYTIQTVIKAKAQDRQFNDIPLAILQDLSTIFSKESNFETAREIAIRKYGNYFTEIDNRIGGEVRGALTKGRESEEYAGILEAIYKYQNLDHAIVQGTRELLASISGLKYEEIDKNFQGYGQVFKNYLSGYLNELFLKTYDSYKPPEGYNEDDLEEYYRTQYYTDKGYTQIDGEWRDINGEEITEIGADTAEYYVRTREAYNAITDFITKLSKIDNPQIKTLLSGKGLLSDYKSGQLAYILTQNGISPDFAGELTAEFLSMFTQLEKLEDALRISTDGANKLAENVDANLATQIVSTISKIRLSRGKSEAKKAFSNLTWLANRSEVSSEDRIDLIQKIVSGEIGNIEDFVEYAELKGLNLSPQQLENIGKFFKYSNNKSYKDWADSFSDEWEFYNSIKSSSGAFSQEDITKILNAGLSGVTRESFGEGGIYTGNVEELAELYRSYLEEELTKTQEALDSGKESVKIFADKIKTQPDDLKGILDATWKSFVEGELDAISEEDLSTIFREILFDQDTELYNPQSGTSVALGDISDEDLRTYAEWYLSGDYQEWDLEQLELGQYKKILQDSFNKLPEAIQNKITEIVTDARKTHTGEFTSGLLTALANGSAAFAEGDYEKFLTGDTLEKINWNNIKSIDDFKAELDDLGISFNNTATGAEELFKALLHLYKTSKIITAEDVAQVAQFGTQLKTKVKTTGNGNYSQEEVDYILAQNGELTGQFVRDIEQGGYTYIGDRNVLEGAVDNSLKRNGFEQLEAQYQLSQADKLSYKQNQWLQTLFGHDYSNLTQEEKDQVAQWQSQRDVIAYQYNQMQAIAPYLGMNNDQARGAGASSEIQQAITLQDAAKAGLSSQEVSSYANILAQISDNLKNAAGNANALAYAVAYDNMVMQQGIDLLASNFTAWKEIIDNGESTVGYGEAVEGLNQSLQKITGTTENFSREFLVSAETMELFSQAAQGDTKALANLKKAAAKDIIKPQLFEDADLAAQVNDAIDGLDLENVKIGAELDTNVADVFQGLLDAGVLTADQVTAALESINYEPNIQYQTMSLGAAKSAHQTAYIASPQGGMTQVTSDMQLSDDTQVQVPIIGSSTRGNAAGVSPTVFKGGTGSTIKPHKGGGGGGGKKEFKNDFDKYYNQVEDINELERQRNLLEKDYNQLLKSENLSGKEIYDNLKAQIGLLKERRFLVQDLAEKRKQQIFDTMQDEQYKDVAKYSWWNEEDQTVEIDWQSIDKIKDSETGNLVKEYVKKLEDFQSKYDEQINALEEIEDTIQDIRERGKDQYNTLEERVRDALIKQIQDKIDELTEVNEAINETNQKLFDSISETLELQRQERENAKTEEELTDKEKRLAYLQQDSSNANALEIEKLQEELADARESYTDTLIDQKISELQKQNEEAQEQRQEQIDLMQRSLEWQENSGAFWNTVYQYISEGTDAIGALIPGSNLVRLLKEGEAWDSLSEEMQMNWLKELETLVSEATGYLALNRQLEDIGTKEGTEIEFITADGRTLKGKVDKNGNVVVNNDDGSTSTYRDVYQDYYGTYKTLETEGELKEAPRPVTTTKPEGTERPPDYTGTDQRYDLGSNAIWRTVIKSVNGKYSSFEEAEAAAKAENDKKEAEVLAEIEQLQGKESLTEQEARLLESRKQLLKYRKKIQYATGGIADFTGPAWLDGTKSHPELVLNARDTQNFIELKDILADMRKNGGFLFTGGDNYYDIKIQVDSIGSDYDIDRAIDRIKARIVQDGAYRNVNTLSRLR